jgi:hypothetical protein
MAIQDLRQELQSLKQELAMRPVRVPTRGGGGGGVVVSYNIAAMLCNGGNSLGTVFSTTVYGIKAPLADLTELPTKNPSNVHTYVNGVGHGYSLVNGNVAGALKWIGLQVKRPDMAAAARDYGGILIKDNIFASISSYRLHVTGSANNAVLVAVLTDGVITDVTITDGGTGFTADSLIYVTGGGGSGAVLVPVLTGGVITDVTIVNGGSGYTSVPTLTAWGDSNLVYLPFYV